MIYELWEYPEGQSFFPHDEDPGTYQENVDLLISQEPEAKLVWTVEADDWDTAMQAMYTYRNWGTFHPLKD
ncbi:MAG: hypothetical protein R3C01_03565 [Planctomycetaceae bacterium]